MRGKDRSALIIAVTGIALLLGDGLLDPVSPRLRLDVIGVDGERTLWLGAAALVFVSSGNILTLASSWLILDAALAVRLHLSHTAEVSGRAWAREPGRHSPALLLTLLGENGIRANLIGPRLPVGQPLDRRAACAAVGGGPDPGGGLPLALLAHRLGRYRGEITGFPST